MKINIKSIRKIKTYLNILANTYITLRNLLKFNQLNGENNRDVCYNKLFKLLIDKGLKKSEFAKQAGLSAPTLVKLGKNEIVSMEVINRICRFFDCKMDEILDVLPETKLKQLYLFYIKEA